MSDEGKVIRPKFGDPKLVVDTLVSRCSHDYVTLRVRDKAVICRSCGEEVEAFDLLVKLTRSWEWATHHQRELENAVNAVEAAKREESNIKARLRSAHKLAVPDARTTVFYDEYMRRLNEAHDHALIRAAHRWASDFKWLDPQQYAAIKEAQIRAERRAEDTRRKGNRRNRHVRVIEGGKKDG